MYRTLELQIKQLEEGIKNINAGIKLEQWDCNAIGQKDNGVVGFPFCGGDGYKTVGCPFDTRLTPGDTYEEGCYYHCNVMQLKPEQQLRKIQATRDNFTKGDINEKHQAGNQGEQVDD